MSLEQRGDSGNLWFFLHLCINASSLELPPTWWSETFSFSAN